MHGFWFAWIAVGVVVCALVHWRLRHEGEHGLGAWEWAAGVICWPMVVLLLLEWLFFREAWDPFNQLPRAQAGCAACGDSVAPLRWHPASARLVCTRCREEIDALSERKH